MARSWTLAQLRDRAKSESDMINSTFVSNQEWQNWINSNLCEVYDLLVQAGPPDYYSVTQPFTTVPGQLAYPLPADFRSMTCAYGVIQTDMRRPIRELNDYELVNFRPPQVAADLFIEYVPVPPILQNDLDTFDGVSGWEELIVAMSARDALMKEESDISGMEAKIANLKSRIRKASSQRGAGPRYINDVNNANSRLYPNTVQVSGCRIRGDNIEFFQPNVLLWWW